jgi:hypothetical protein
MWWGTIRTSLVPIFDKPFTMREGPTAISTATATATAKASAGGDGATNTVSAGGNAGAVGVGSAGATRIWTTVKDVALSQVTSMI